MVKFSLSSVVPLGLAPRIAFNSPASEGQLIASRLVGVASAIKRRPRSVAHAVPRQGQERMIEQ